MLQLASPPSITFYRPTRLTVRSRFQPSMKKHSGAPPPLPPVFISLLFMISTSGRKLGEACYRHNKSSRNIITMSGALGPGAAPCFSSSSLYQSHSGHRFHTATMFHSHVVRDCRSVVEVHSTSAFPSVVDPTNFLKSRPVADRHLVPRKLKAKLVIIRESPVPCGKGVC